MDEKKLDNVIKNLMLIHSIINVIKNKLHEFFNAHNFIGSTKNFLIRDNNCAVFFEPYI